MKNLWKITLIATFFGLIAVAPIQSQDNAVRLDHFDEIRVRGDVEVILEEGATESARLEAMNISEDKVKIEVKKGTLKVSLLNSVFSKDGKVKVYVTYQTLRSARASAGGRITGRGTISGDKLEARAGSGAVVELAVAMNALDIRAKEGGEVALSGTSKRQNVSVSTGGHYKGLELETATTYIKANTGGLADVHVINMLEVSANTGGIVNYKGNPNETSFKEFMSGGITKL
ncbi:MAG: head GIN domain-containing protein [Bacteroidota bacterium]